MKNQNILTAVIVEYIQEDKTAFLVNILATLAATIAAAVALATGVEPGPETWGFIAVLAVIAAEVIVHTVYFTACWIKEVKLAKKSRASL